MIETYFKKKLSQLGITCKSTLASYDLAPLTFDILLPNEILLQQRNFFTPFLSTFLFLQKNQPSVAAHLQSHYTQIMSQFYLQDIKKHQKKYAKHQVSSIFLSLAR
jgi:hypothetical protein